MNPLAAMNGVVVEVAGLGHEPAGVRENPHATPFRHLDRLFLAQQPLLRRHGNFVGLQSSLEVLPLLHFIDLPRMAFKTLLSIPSVARGHKGFSSGQQRAKHLFVGLEHPSDQAVCVVPKPP